MLYKSTPVPVQSDSDVARITVDVASFFLKWGWAYIIREVRAEEGVGLIMQRGLILRTIWYCHSMKLELSCDYHRRAVIVLMYG